MAACPSVGVTSCSAKNRYISYMLSGARLQLDWLNKPGNVAQAHINCLRISCIPSGTFRHNTRILDPDPHEFALILSPGSGSGSKLLEMLDPDLHDKM